MIKEIKRMCRAPPKSGNGREKERKEQTNGYKQNNEKDRGVPDGCCDGAVFACLCPSDNSGGRYSLESRD